MADKITVTTIVDMLVKSGKLDTKSFDKEMPKALEAYFSKMAGVETKIKVDPKLQMEPGKLAAQLRTLLADEKFHKQHSSAANFSVLTDSMREYATSLEHISKVTSDYSKFSKPFLTQLEKLKEGTLPTKTFDSKAFQDNLTKYQAHGNAVAAVAKQIQNQEQNIHKVHNTVDAEGDLSQLFSGAHLSQGTGLAVAAFQKNLKDINKAVSDTEKATKTQIANLDKLQVAMDRTDAARGKSASRGRFDSHFKKQEKHQVIEAKAAMENEVSIRKTLANSGNTSALNTKRSGWLTTGIESARDNLKGVKQVEVAPIVAEQVSKAQVKKRELLVQDEELAAYEARGKKFAKRKNLEESEEYQAYLAEGKKLYARKLLIETEQYNAWLAEGKAAQKAQAKLDKENLARTRVNNLVSHDSPTLAADLKALSGNEIRHIRTVIRDEKANQKHLTGQLDHPDYAKFLARDTALQNILNHLDANSAQNKEDKKANTPAALARVEAANAKEATIQRGEHAYNTANQNIADIHPRDHAATKAYLQSARDAADSRANASTRTHHAGHADTIAATEEARHYTEALRQLSTTANNLHPIMDRLGGLFSQFARYAIGYAALYKITGALSAMASEVVNLEDKMKGIQAITGSTTSEMEQMSASIKQVAVTSAFSISDIADAVKTVAQSGTELKDIPKTIQAVANLASASGTSLQTAADVLTTAKAVWENVSVTEISDRVTQAANVSKLAVEDLSTIFNLGASSAKSANVSLDHYLGVIATLKNSGMKASTIATGTSQLLTEVTAPDKKFGDFLSKRYQAVGEKVTTAEAQQKFASFKHEDNPILAALNELKRIGADSAAAMPGLTRALDIRSIRVLQPLFAHMDKLLETNGKLATAPTAQDASKIAMDSLKKATGNLGDQFNILADTLAKDALPPLTAFIKSISNGVGALDKLINKNRQVLDEEKANRRQVPGIFSPIDPRVDDGPPAGAFQAELAAKAAEAAQYSHTRFIQPTDDTFAPKDSLSAQTSSADQKLDKIKQDTANALGADKAPDGMTSEQLAQRLKDIPAKSGPMRTEALKQLQKDFEGKGEIDDVAISEVKTISGEVSGSVLGLVAGIAKRYIELITKSKAGTLEKGSADLKELEAMRAQQRPDAIFKKILEGSTGDAPAKSILASIQAHSKKVYEGLQGIEGGAYVSPTDNNLQGLQSTQDQISRSKGENKFLHKQGLSEVIASHLNTHGAGGAPDIANSLDQPKLSEFSPEQLDAGIAALIGTPKKPGPLVMAESSNVDGQVSSAGAVGRMQLLKDTHFGTGNVMTGLPKLKDDATPEAQQAHAAKYLKLMATQKGHEGWTLNDLLKGYNAGPNATEKALKQGTASNTKYTRDVSKGSALGRAPVTSETTMAGNTELIRQLGEQYQTDLSSLKAIGDTANSQADIINASPERDKRVSYLSSTGKPIASTPAALNQGSIDEIPKAVTSLEATIKKYAEFVAAPADAKLKLWEEIRPTLGQQGGIKPLLDQGLVQRNVENPTLLEQDPQTRTKKIFDKEQTKLAIEKPKTEYREDQKIAEDIKILEEQQNALHLTDRPALLAKDATGLTLPQRINQLQNSQLDAQTAHIQGNTYSHDEQEKKVQEADLAKVASEKRALDVKFTNEQAQLSFDVEKADLKIRQETLATRIAVLEELRRTLAGLGKLELFDQEVLTKAQAEQIKNDTSLLNLQSVPNEKVTQEKITAETNKLNLRKTQGDNQVVLDNFSSKQQQISTGLNYYSPEQLVQNAYHQSVGQTQGIANQESFAKYQVNAQASLTASIEAQLRASEASLAAEKGQGQSFVTLTDQTQKLKAQFIEASVTLVDYNAKVEALNPTLGGELSQISGTSIGAKLADLPSSLKNLNTNIENRAVTAVDQATTGLAESAISAAKSLLGLQKIPEMLLQTWSGLQVAQGNHAQTVAQGSVNLATQISSIRNNETDPVRQEMLIQRAQAAQSQSEAIAQNQVDQANNAYQKAQYDNSFAGKAGGAATDFITGAATDYLKGSVTQGIADMFRGDPKAGINSDGRILKTATGAQVVNVENFPGGVPGVGAAGASPAAGGLPVGANILGDPLVPFATIPTTSGTPANSATGDPSTKTADTIAESINSSLSAPWYSGFTDELSGGFNSLIGGLNTSFTSFTGALGVAMGLSNVHKTDTLGEVQKYLGLALSVTSLATAGMGAWDKFTAPSAGSVIPKFTELNNPSMLNLQPIERATGGSVFGAGTGTSDSIPTMLSNGEYVINAKTAAAIGHDTLDAWNFASARPGRFATGGSIGNLASSVSNIAAPTSATQAAPAVATPQSIRVVMVDDQRDVKNYLTSSEGEKVLVDFVKRNSLSLKSVLR